MRRVARVVAVLVAVTAADAVVHAVEPNQSATVLGPTNPKLADGAAALDAGHVEEGIRLTLAGLNMPTPTRDRAAGYSNLCAGYAMLKQWDEALKYCDTAISLDTNNWRAFNNRAAVYVGKGQYDRAVSDIRAGLDIAPDSSTLLESLRVVQHNKQLFERRSRSATRPP